MIALLFALALAGVPAPTTASASGPFLSAARGGLLMSWLEPAASGATALRFARLANGAWSAPRTIVQRNDLFVNSADFPSIVEDANGVLFAQWVQKSGDVRMTLSNDGGATWRAPFLLNRDGKQGEHGFVSLAPLPGGGVAAAWLDGREAAMSLRYATIDARGTMRSDVALDTRTCECCATGMAMTKSGPVIVYRDRSAEEIRDIAVVKRGWAQPRLVHADGWKILGCPVNGPQVDAIGERVVVAWFTAAHEQPRALVAFSDDGGATFAAPIAIDDGKPVGHVDVVLVDRDHAVVTWLEQNELRARRVERYGKVDPSLKIGSASGFPRIARIGSDVYVAWAADKRVRVARVSPSPAAR